MSSIEVYNNKADIFEQQYLSVAAEDVHQAWLSRYLPQRGIALDVGAGIGRDAKYLAEKGLNVVAVEPANELLQRGQKLTQGLNVHWISDQLPDLSEAIALDKRFDLILLSAVWMHIPHAERQGAFQTLASLLKSGGKIVITLRHGTSPDAREMYPVSVNELEGFVNRHGLTLHVLADEDDKLQRKEVSWETVVIESEDSD